MLVLPVRWIESTMDLPITVAILVLMRDISWSYGSRLMYPLVRFGLPTSTVIPVGPGGSNH
jgi:hypothetical protein